MSDPIAEMLRPCMRGSRDVRKKVANDLAKQIRQQIGRELLEKRMQLDDFVHCDYIREVCQLEES